MLFIVLRAVCNALCAQFLRLGQGQRPHMLGVITVNYAVATLVSLALAGWHGPVRYLPTTVGLGALGGVAYIASILVLMPAMRESGVAVSVAVLQLAILWPVAYAMLAFGEIPSPAQWVGIAAAVAALVLLSMGGAAPRVRPVPERQASKAGRRFSPLLLPLFLVTGISGISMKAFHEYAPALELPGFM